MVAHVAQSVEELLIIFILIIILSTDFFTNNPLEILLLEQQGFGNVIGLMLNNWLELAAILLSPKQSVQA